MSGVDKLLGKTLLNVTIYNISSRVRLFVTKKESEKYQCVIGCDLISIFYLNSDFSGKVSQSLPLENSLLTPVKNYTNATINWNDSTFVEQFEAKKEHLNQEQCKIIFNLL